MKISKKNNKVVPIYGGQSFQKSGLSNKIKFEQYPSNEDNEIQSLNLAPFIRRLDSPCNSEISLGYSDISKGGKTLYPNEKNTAIDMNKLNDPDRTNSIQESGNMNFISNSESHDLIINSMDSATSSKFIINVKENNKNDYNIDSSIGYSQPEIKRYSSDESSKHSISEEEEKDDNEDSASSDFETVIDFTEQYNKMREIAELKINKNEFTDIHVIEEVESKYEISGMSDNDSNYDYNKSPIKSNVKKLFSLSNFQNKDTILSIYNNLSSSGVDDINDSLLAKQSSVVSCQNSLKKLAKPSKFMKFMNWIKNKPADESQKTPSNENNRKRFAIKKRGGSVIELGSVKAQDENKFRRIQSNKCRTENLVSLKSLKGYKLKHSVSNHVKLQKNVSITNFGEDEFSVINSSFGEEEDLDKIESN